MPIYVLLGETETCKTRMKRRSGRRYASAGPLQMQIANRRRPAPTIESRRLFAVWDPDIFDLRGVLEEPAAFRLLGIKPIDRAAFVRPDLFQISTRHRLRCGDGSLVPVTPNPIDVIVFGECL